MKNAIGSFVLVFLLSSSPLLAAKDIAKETLSFAGKERTYYLYVPKSLKPDAPAPVVVLFHGSNRNGLSLVEKWKKLADEEGVVLVGPDATDTAFWQLKPDGPDFIKALIEQVSVRQPIQPRRMYLWGHSAGAGYAVILAMLESEYFAAAAIHAGMLGEQNHFVIDKAKRKIPIFIAIGTEDAQFPLDLVRGTRDALAAKGIPVEIDEIKGHNHWYYDLAPKINRKAWDFLKQHELPGDPKFQVYQR